MRNRHRHHRRGFVARLACAVVGFALLTVAPATAAPAPAGDQREQPVAVDQLPFTATQDVRGATSAPDDPSCSGNGHSVWYRLRPTRNATLSIDTYGSDYDTTLAVYGADGELLACADDTRGVQAAVRVDVRAGAVYDVMAAACCGRAAGTLTLNASEVESGPSLALTVQPTMQRAGGSVRATVSGSVTCARASSVQLEVRLHDDAGRPPTAVGYGETACEGQASWAVPVVPRGAATKGPVPVTVTALSCDDMGRCRIDEVAARVRLVR
ncbi:hypothetical protein [Egicoccus sp. AB-alg2]|uniref:hypothetical protein n=1 Tax=Egicoccus sp. AB-alg2 TaxID=3242693 RepID=UPI00359D796F